MKILSGILGSTVAAGLTYLVMGMIALDSVNIGASLAVGASMGFLVGSVNAILDRKRPQSMLYSIISGGAFSLVCVALLVAAIMYGDDISTDHLRPDAILELVSLGLLGVAGGAAYRLIVDYKPVRDFLALTVTSGLGAAIGAAFFGLSTSYLKLGVVMVDQTLIVSAGIGAVFGLIYAIVHCNMKPSVAASVVTALVFLTVALLICFFTGWFLGWPIAAITGLIGAPFFVGGCAGLGLRQRG